MNELFTHGFKVWHRPDIADLLSVDDLQFDQSKNLTSKLPENCQELVQSILKVQSYEIINDYIKPYSISFKELEHDIKANSPEGSKFLSWHTDSDEPGNVFFLLYFNDMINDEGALHIKNNIGEFKVVPKYGTLVALNNTDGSILHKAEFTEQRRIVACFDYDVEWDNDKL